MTIQQWLTSAMQQLAEASIATARLDCLVLLEDQLGHDRAWLLSHADTDLQGSDAKKLNTKIVQRVRHIPLAYIRGHAEFYGREFIVNEQTLVPRPETETMIELLKHVRNREADVAAFQVERRGRKPIRKQYPFEKQQPKSQLVKTDDGYKVVWQKPARPRFTQAPAPVHGQNLRHHDENLYLFDIGTGSGAIAITAKLEMPAAKVYAVDIDASCLEVARRNAVALGADVTFVQGDLAEPIAAHWPHNNDSAITVLLCNLPYVPDDFHINTAATHEPKHAIFGGADGLDLYRRMFHQLATAGTMPQYILTESLPPQHELLAALAAEAGYQLLDTNDFILLFGH